MVWITSSVPAFTMFTVPSRTSPVLLSSSLRVMVYAWLRTLATWIHSSTGFTSKAMLETALATTTASSPSAR